METHFQCPHCGFENPGDSLFCTECGKRLSEIRKSVEGTQRKCRNCGNFNELEALFCVACGKEMIRSSKEGLKRRSEGPSYKTMALVIILVFVFGLLIKLGITVFKESKSSKFTSPPTPMAQVDEAQVIAVAKNFKCACGGCGELPLATCECDMPNGAVEEKNFIRKKLREGFTVEQVIEMVDKMYGHRI